MSARVLVVDDIAVNLRLLEAKLTAEYYEVITASDGYRALEMVATQAPDIVLLDVMMPGLNGFEVCRKIKETAETTQIPVVMVTALGDVRDRVRGLEAGADDFLTKPLQDVALFARIKSLVRLKRACDEFRMRETLSVQLGGEEQVAIDDQHPSNILLVQDTPRMTCRVTQALAPIGHRLVQANSLAAATVKAQQEDFSLFLVADRVGGEDALYFCAQLRANPKTRHAAILLMIGEGETRRLAKALELGVSDYVVCPIDRDEMIARTRTQIRRKRYEDRLRDNYQRSLAAALVDSLTGLYNRRYLEAHYQAVSTRAMAAGKPLSILMLDIDQFKGINDSYGHAAGDEILIGLADRITGCMRGFDITVRLGGDEFIVMLVDTTESIAIAAARRLCRQVADQPFRIGVDPFEVALTVSIGVATLPNGQGTLDDALRDADKALYMAKAAGRNCIKPDSRVETDENERVNLKVVNSAN